MNIPGTAKEVLNELLINKVSTIPALASALNLGVKTLYRVLNGTKVSGKTEVKLIRVYCQAAMAGSLPKPWQ